MIHEDGGNKLHNRWFARGVTTTMMVIKLNMSASTSGKLKNSIFLPVRRKKYGIVLTNIAWNWMDILERGCEPRTHRLSKQGIEILGA